MSEFILREILRARQLDHLKQAAKCESLFLVCNSITFTLTVLPRDTMVLVSLGSGYWRLALLAFAVGVLVSDVRNCVLQGLQ